MLKRITLTIAAVALILAAQPGLFAQKGPAKQREGKENTRECMNKPGERGHFFGNPAHMQKKLGLTDAQVTQISGINKEYEKKMLPIKEKRAPMKYQLRKLLLEDSIDMGRVRTLLKDMADLKVELHILRIQHRLDIEKVLTPDQKAKLRTHRMHKGKMGRGHGMNRG